MAGAEGAAGAAGVRARGEGKDNAAPSTRADTPLSRDTRLARARRTSRRFGQFTAVPGVKSIYQNEAVEENPFEFVKPDDKWQDEKCVRRPVQIEAGLWRARGRIWHGGAASSASVTFRVRGVL